MSLIHQIQEKINLLKAELTKLDKLHLTFLQKKNNSLQIGSEPDKKTEKISELVWEFIRKKNQIRNELIKLDQEKTFLKKVIVELEKHKSFSKIEITDLKLLSKSHQQVISAKRFENKGVFILHLNWYVWSWSSTIIEETKKELDLKMILKRKVINNFQATGRNKSEDEKNQQGI